MTSIVDILITIAGLCIGILLFVIGLELSFRVDKTLEAYRRAPEYFPPETPRSLERVSIVSGFLMLFGIAICIAVIITAVG